MPATLPAGPEHDPLVVELGGDQPPAGVLLADQHVDRHPHIVVVAGVGVVGAVAGDDRRPRVARILGVDDQDRNALVLHGFRIGAAGQPDVVGVVGAGGEDLLAVDDVLVALADGGGAQRCQVGAGLRLGVADREVHLAGQDRRQELLLLRLAAVLLQRRSDGLQRHRGQRHVGAGRLVDEDLLFDRPEPVAAELLGPADAELAVLAHPADHRAVGLAVPVGLHLLGLFGRDQARKVLPQFGLQRSLLRGQVDEHCAPTRSRRCDGPPTSRVRSLTVE